MTGTTGGALSRVSQYLRMRRAKPLRTLDGSIHRIHAGTEWDAELQLADLHVVMDVVTSPPSRDEIEAVADALVEAGRQARSPSDIRTEMEAHAKTAIEAFLRTRRDRTDATAESTGTTG